MIHILKALLGGGVSGIISMLSRSQYFLLSGLLPFFPTFTLIAHISAYETGDVAHTKSISLFMIFAVLPIIGYNICVYALVGRMAFWLCITYALIVWFILSFIVYMGWIKIVG